MKKEEESEDLEKSDLEKEVSDSEDSKDEIREQNKDDEDFEIQQNFIETFGSNIGIKLPDFSEPILERIRTFSQDNLETDIITTSVTRIKSDDYEKGKYQGSNYLENKYEKKTPDYMSKSSSDNDRKEKSDQDTRGIR